MKARNKIPDVVLAAIGFAAIFAVLLLTRKSGPPVYFSCAGFSVSSNTSQVSIVISNPSAADIVYFIGGPLLKSNGAWETIRTTNRVTRLLPLAAGQSATGVVAAPFGSGEARIGVLWGFAVANLRTTNASLRQDIREDIADWFLTHDFRGRGALYTNYVAGIHF